MPAAFQSLSQKKDLLPYSGTEMALSKSAGFKAQNQVWNVTIINAAVNQDLGCAPHLSICGPVSGLGVKSCLILPLTVIIIE